MARDRGRPVRARERDRARTGGASRPSTPTLFGMRARPAGARLPRPGPGGRDRDLRCAPDRRPPAPARATARRGRRSRSIQYDAVEPGTWPHASIVPAGATSRSRCPTSPRRWTRSSRPGGGRLRRGRHAHDVRRPARDVVLRDRSRTATSSSCRPGREQASAGRAPPPARIRRGPAGGRAGVRPRDAVAARRRRSASVEDLVQAVDEATCNVMLHGYGGAPGRDRDRGELREGRDRDPIAGPRARRSIRPPRPKPDPAAAASKRSAGRHGRRHPPAANDDRRGAASCPSRRRQRAHARALDRRPRPRRAEPMAMTIDVEHLGGRSAGEPWSTLDGELDASNYEQVIEIVREAYARGARGPRARPRRADVHGQLRPVRPALGGPDHARRDAAGPRGRLGRAPRDVAATTTRTAANVRIAAAQDAIARVLERTGMTPAVRRSTPTATTPSPRSREPDRRALGRRAPRARAPGRPADPAHASSCSPASRPTAGRSRATTGPPGPSAATSSTSSRSSTGRRASSASSSPTSPARASPRRC